MAAPRAFGVGPYSTEAWPADGRRPFGSGTFGVSVYSTYQFLDVGGVSLLGLAPANAPLRRTWQQSYPCEAGTWTLTTLPAGPPNTRELETAS
jgi:hypothetical protein